MVFTQLRSPDDCQRSASSAIEKGFKFFDDDDDIEQQGQEHYAINNHFCSNSMALNFSPTNNDLSCNSVDQNKENLSSHSAMIIDQQNPPLIHVNNANFFFDSDSRSPGGSGIKRPSVNDEHSAIIVVDMKRHKSVTEESMFTSLKVPPPSALFMQRCRSDSELNHAIQLVENNSSLIGDISRNHILPLLSHPKVSDIKCVNGQTVCDVLDSRYAYAIDKFTIIDCRYPYEYDGGHIRGAINVFTQEKLLKLFFNEEIPKSQTNNVGSVDENSQLSPTCERQVLLFYCEYSKERGPKMWRFLRTQDRKRNEQLYPKLYYPEIYLLEGGYKTFYEHFKNYCEPQEYKSMTHRDHLDDLRKFRIKSKSWSSFGAAEMSSPWSGAEPQLAPVSIRRPGLNRGLFT